MPANGRGVQLVVAVSAAAAAAWAICTSSSCAAWAPHATAAGEWEGVPGEVTTLTDAKKQRPRGDRGVERRSHMNETLSAVSASRLSA